MAKKEKILLATDLTARGDRPLDRALMLASDRDAELLMLHVLDKKHIKTLEGLGIDPVEHIRSHMPLAAEDAEILVRKGHVPQTITKTADEFQCDLIVTGVARYNSLGDIFLGTPVDHIVRHTKIPVLVVKQRPSRSYQNIIVGTDFSSCSRNALLTAARLFPDATLHVVHGYHVPYGSWLKSEQVEADITAEENNMLKEFVAHPEISADVRKRIDAKVELGPLETVISKKLTDTDADLVVLGTHGQSGFSHATLGSNAEGLLTYLGCDVMMIREGKKR